MYEASGLDADEGIMSVGSAGPAAPLGGRADVKRAHPFSSSERCPAAHGMATPTLSVASSNPPLSAVTSPPPLCNASR